MKRLGLIAVIVGLVLLLLTVLWLRSGDENQRITGYTTTVELSGTTNATFNGNYLQEGKRIQISGVLPWNLIATNLTYLEIRKVKVEDNVRLDARGGGS